MAAKKPACAGLFGWRISRAYRTPFHRAGVSRVADRIGMGHERGSRAHRHYAAEAPCDPLVMRAASVGDCDRRLLAGDRVPFKVPHGGTKHVVPIVRRHHADKANANHLRLCAADDGAGLVRHFHLMTPVSRAFSPVDCLGELRMGHGALDVKRFEAIL